MSCLEAAIICEEGISFTHLVDGWDDGPRLCQSLQVGHAPVADTNSLDFTRVVEVFHLLPSLALVPTAVYRARAVRIYGKQLMRLVRNKAARGRIIRI